MLKNHFKIALRNLKKRMGTALINILGLSLGFGCAILIFLFVNYHLSFDNFHRNSDRIYRAVSEQHMDRVMHVPSVPPGFVKTFKTDYGYAEKVARMHNWQEDMVTVKGDKTIRIKENIAFAEPEFFQIFNFPLLNAQHLDQLSAPNTAILTQKAALKLFGKTNPINQTFVLANKETITVKGILKNLPNNTFLTAQIFVSFKTIAKYNEFVASDEWTGTTGELQCFTLLHPNQNIQNIESELAKLAAKYQEKNGAKYFRLQPFQSMHLDPTYYGMNPKMLWILALIGFFLLLIACVNFINISTAQAVYRSKEVGVRKVLGSLKKQLLWQFLTETFLITLVALILGLALSMFVLPYFNSIFDISLSLTSLLSVRFVVFALLLLLGIAALAGSYPGIVLARIKPIMALKGKLTQRDAGGSFTRKTLVTSQFIISMVLIIASLVISKQLKYAINSDLGYGTTAMVMVDLPAEYDPIKLNLLKERVKQSPHVQRVSGCFASPGAANNNWSTSVFYNNRTEYENFGIFSKIADENYLETFDLKLVTGRNFTIKDTVDEILVNETFGKKLGLSSSEELLGKELNLSGGYIKGKIVGVIADFHDKDFKQHINPVFIAPVKDRYNELAVKINLSNTEDALTHIGKQWNSVFPNYIFEHSFLDERVAEMYRVEQQFLSLTQIFSVLAIFIGCLGIYGLISFFVAQRTKEIGIRKVLGGTVTDILGLFAKDFFKLVIIAGVIATPLAWYFMNNWLQNFTYRTQINWWIFALAVASVLSITLLIIGYKGIKAATANPIKSLRTE